MILDKLENINRYLLDLNFIKIDLTNDFRAGRFEIFGDEKFGIGLEYETKESQLCLWEGHNLYLDIHVILEGEEIVEVADVENMSITKPYVEDYTLFDGIHDQRIILKKGYFLVLFPNEIHKTGIKIDKNTRILKNVYKSLIQK